MADKKRYKALKSLETKDTKGVHFITAEELKVRNRLGTFGLVWFGLVWFGLVWFGTLLGGDNGGIKILVKSKAPTTMFTVLKNFLATSTEMEVTKNKNP
jgi:hypothetical protein